VFELFEPLQVQFPYHGGYEMTEATIARPIEPLKRIAESFPDLHIRTTTVHHNSAPKRFQPNQTYDHGPNGSPIQLAELEGEIGALRGYLEGLRHVGWMNGIIGIFIGNGVNISGIIKVEANQPEQMATLETMLNELHRRAIVLSDRGVTAVVRCAYEPE
jgi:hypothetical protein